MVGWLVAFLVFIRNCRIFERNNQKKLQNAFVGLRAGYATDQCFIRLIDVQGSLLEWLQLLRLQEYYDSLTREGYMSIDQMTEITWEDLEEVGIQKLGQFSPTGYIFDGPIIFVYTHQIACFYFSLLLLFEAYMQRLREFSAKSLI